MSYETLQIERGGGVARVWLNRPERLNALNGTALNEITDVFTAFQRDFETRVIVLGGRGSSFSSGADRTQPPAPALEQDPSGRERRYLSQAGRRALEAVERVEATTIARLHGHVIGGAFVLALGCDLRIAAETTSFLVPEVELGIPLTWGAVPRLIREVGMARAKEIVLMCEGFDGRTAAEWGLVNRVVPDGDLDAEVDRWAARLSGMPEWALHMSKTQFRAYGLASVLGDVTETDGDLLAGASRFEPGRFAMPEKQRQPADR